MFVALLIVITFLIFVFWLWTVDLLAYFWYWCFRNLPYNRRDGWFFKLTTVVSSYSDLKERFLMLSTIVLLVLIVLLISFFVNTGSFH